MPLLTYNRLQCMKVLIKIVMFYLAFDPGQFLPRSLKFLSQCERSVNLSWNFQGKFFMPFLLLRKKDGRHAHTADRFSQRKLVCAVTSIFAEDTPHPTPDLALPLASGIRPSYYGERYGLRKRSKIFEKFKKHRPTATHVFLSKPEKMFVIMF